MQAGLNKKQGWLSRMRTRAWWRVPLFLVLLAIGGSVSSASYADCRLCSKHGASDRAALAAALEKRKADSDKRFVEQILEATNLLKMFNKMREMWEMMTGLLGDQKEILAAIDAAKDKLVENKKVDIQNAELQHDYAVSTVEHEAQHAEENVQPPSEQSGLCYMITGRQVVPVMDQFADIIARTALDGLMADRSGNGPFYAARMRRIRCGQMNKNDPVTGSAADGPGCKGAQNVQVAKGLTVSFEGLGVSAMTMSPDSVVMMAPQLTETTESLPNGQTRKVTLATAKEGNVQQQVWLAAFDYCASMANPRPIPTSGSDAKTPSGVSVSSAEATCASRESSFLSLCADRLGRMSRPDCSLSEMKPFCEVARNLCMAAKAYALPLEDKYEDCAKGLSYYEAETIAVRLCEAAGRAHDQVAGGAKNPQLAGLALDCDDLGIAHKQRKSEDWRAFTQMAAKIEKVKGCWAQTGSTNN